MIRNELSEMISLSERLNAAAEPAVLATLFAAHGSTYRPLGSMMLGGPSSALTAGGVSGGCLEDYIARRGRALTDQQPAVMLSFEANPDADHTDVPSLGCGGSIEVLVERFTPDHLAFLRQFAAVHDADQASTAACVIDTSASPTITVRRLLWTGDHKATTIGPQLELLRERAMCAASSMEGPIGSELRALVHYVRPLVRLVILGAGNDARPLCTLGRSLGWHVCVADRRARLATRGRFPDADQLVADNWWTALRSITFTPQTAVVLMTHSLADDAEVLPLLAERPAAYVGVLGPEHRRRWLLENVADTATLPAEFVNRLRGPVGLDLGDRSAGGIAVSIVSEILAELNGRTPASLFQSGSAESAARPSRVAVTNVR
jgi:xanthine dehydrogenase accessory factor